MLFLTSHGSPDVFSLSFWEAGTRSLSSADFARMLDESGLRNAVIVVSACYSGSFIDELSAPDRLIITAADDESTSFGCGDGRDWTWWGKAFFHDALAETRDFRSAFRRATTIVQGWEAEQGQKASNPQIQVGEAIAARLDRLAEDADGP